MKVSASAHLTPGQPLDRRTLVRAAPLSGLSREEEAILSAVTYSSVFDYPLTIAETRRALPGLVLDDGQILECYQSSPKLNSLVGFRDGFFFPRGYDHLVEKREQHTCTSQALLAENKSILRCICSLPNTRVVALSGSVAHLNVGTAGDIDLFIIVRGFRVWTIAVWILLLTKFVGRRRLFCFNFILSDDDLAVAPTDLFTANQIIHLKPILGRELCARFIESNPFVERFYPGFSGFDHSFSMPAGRVMRGFKRALEIILFPALSRGIESVCRETYRRYLLRTKGQWSSPDQVVMKPGYLKLHTESHRREVLRRYESAWRDALKKLNHPD